MTDENATQFGAWLRQKMEDLGTNQRQLALALNVYPATVSNWMRGTRVPSTDSCYLIADALLLDPDEVLERAGKRRAPGDASLEARELHRIIEALTAEETAFVVRFVRFFLADRKRVQAQRAQRVPDHRARLRVRDVAGARSHDHPEA